MACILFAKSEGLAGTDEATTDYAQLRAAVGRLEGERDAVRQAVADYMQSEGCSCCRDIDAHEKHTARLAELLSVPMYDDGSGYEFSKFRSDRAAAQQLAADGERAEAEAGTCQCAYPRVIPGQFFTCINCGRPFRISRT
jgi:outer membrane murein-binding lipoprotein Lpp